MLQQVTTCWGICLQLPVLYEINTPLNQWHSNVQLLHLSPNLICVCTNIRVCVCVREKERDHDRGRKSTSSVALGKYHSETDRCLSPSDSYLHLTMCLAPWAWGHAYTHFDTHAQQCNKQTQCACLCVCVYFCVQYMFVFSSLSKTERKPIPDATDR